MTREKSPVSHRQLPQQFLLMRHADRWDLPKGHCDGDETFLETALRETEEETGLTSDQVEIVPEFRFELCYPVQYRRHKGKVFQKQVVYFLGYVDSTFTPTLTEHESFDWFGWQPPHRIQEQTIDPLLAAIETFLIKKQ